MSNTAFVAATENETRGQKLDEYVIRTALGSVLSPLVGTGLLENRDPVVDLIEAGDPLKTGDLFDELWPDGPDDVSSEAEYELAHEEAAGLAVNLLSLLTSDAGRAAQLSVLGHLGNVQRQSARAKRIGEAS